MRYKRITLLVFLTGIILALAGCYPAVQKAEGPEITTIEAAPLSSSLNTVNPSYHGTVVESRLVGCDRLLIVIKVDGDINEASKPTIRIGQPAFEKMDPIRLLQKENLFYAVFDDLRPDTVYTIYVSTDESETTLILLDNSTVATPARQISIKQVNERISGELSGISISDENRLLFETQACLKLLGLDTDSMGTFGALTQANLVRFEYTCNAFNQFADTQRVMGVPSQETLNLLKSELSVVGENGGESMIADFRLIPHDLSQYADLVSCEVNDEETRRATKPFCGKINIDAYIYDIAKLNEEARQTYQDFPFIMDSPEFESLYKTKNLTKLQTENEAAKNKAMFALHQCDWLKEVTMPQEKTILVASSDGDQITVSALIALSYITIDAYKETGQVFYVRSGMRTYREQELIYYQAEKLSQINYWRTVAWYKQRQKVAEAPGFSNHQYGIAIDFEGKPNGGISSFAKLQPELYAFLINNGPAYGFYRNSSENWHWAYLGMSF